MSDTDSIATHLGDVVDKCKPRDPHQFLLDFGRSALEPVIEKAYSELALKVNTYKNTMVMKTEKFVLLELSKRKKDTYSM